MMHETSLVVRGEHRLQPGLLELPHALHRGPIQVFPEFSMFEELSCVDVGLHLVAGDEEIVLAVNLAGSWSSRCIWADQWPLFQVAVT